MQRDSIVYILQEATTDTAHRPTTPTDSSYHIVNIDYSIWPDVLTAQRM
jgi:hypothetical protein